jgi:hypothetical protein
MYNMREHQVGERRDNRWKWALIGFLAVAAFFLWTEHRAHLLGVLPYLLILACPLMHMFHHGHGHGGGHQQHDSGTGPLAKAEERESITPDRINQ